MVGPPEAAAAAAGKSTAVTARVAPAVAALRWAYQPMVSTFDHSAEDAEGKEKGNGSVSTEARSPPLVGSLG